MNIPIIHNDHAYVDLGLSVNWATSNIGAIYPEHAGYYWSNYEREDGAVSWLAMDDAMCSEQDFGPGIFTVLMVTTMEALGDVPIRPVFTKK